MRTKWRAAFAAGALAALGAGLAANASGLFGLIAPPATLPAMERSIALRFPDVRHLSPSDLGILIESRKTRLLLVDVREEEEYAVSRLDGALRIDPAASADAIAALIGDKAAGADVVFYCSVGLRSAAMARRAQSVLAEQGARGVYNLQGGVFAWRNDRRPVVNDQGPTDYVHPYDEKWGRLLNDAGGAAYAPRNGQ